jgi:hypothetical protein
MQSNFNDDTHVFLHIENSKFEHTWNMKMNVVMFCLIIYKL